MDDIAVLEKVGFWGVMLYLLLKQSIIPAVNKMIPAKIQAAKNADNRRWTLQERETVAIENIANTQHDIKELLVATNERLSVMESSHAEMARLLQDHSKALAVLLAEAQKPKRTRKKAIE